MRYKLYNPLKSDEKYYIPLKEAIKHAKKEGINITQKDLEWLKKHQDEIPQDWKEYWLYATEILEDPDGRRCVPCLDWYDGRWILHFLRLGSDFGRSARFVRPRESWNALSLSSLEDRISVLEKFRKRIEKAIKN